MQELKVYQSLWAMEQRKPGVAEKTAEENFASIAAAGFDGICLDPAPHEINATLEKLPLFERFGLECMINAFPSNTDDLRALIELAQAMRATQFSIIGTTYPLTARAAEPVIRDWLGVAQEMGMQVLFETHRDCITNDMFMTLELLEAIPELRLCADLSHYALNREIGLPLSDEFAELFKRLLSRSDSFQGRISTHEQIQVPLGFPQHAAWEEQHRRWWRWGVADWRARADADDTLIFLCELGPPPYAITDANGYELSDRFAEAQLMKAWIEQIWREGE